MIAVTLFIMFGLVLAASYVLYDQLVRLAYEEYRDAWEADGKPSGFFWTPPENASLRSVFSRPFANETTFLLWLSETPAWMQNQPQAKAKLKVCRTLFIVGIVGLWSAWLYGIATSNIGK